MDKTCAICFEEMDMQSYQDGHDQTSSCFKLECEHAYHTKCIVTCLQKTQHKCPQCNSHKSPDKILTMEGLLSEVFDDVRSKKELKNDLTEYKQSRKQLDNTIKLLKNDLKKYAETRKQELQFQEKKTEYNNSIRKVKLKFLKICKEKGPLYYGAYNNTTEWRRNRLIFKCSRNFIKRRFPYMTIKL